MTLPGRSFVVVVIRVKGVVFTINYPTLSIQISRLRSSVPCIAFALTPGVAYRLISPWRVSKCKRCDRAFYEAKKIRSYWFYWFCIILPSHYFSHNVLNLSGSSAVYLTVCSIDLCPRYSWMSRVSLPWAVSAYPQLCRSISLFCHSGKIKIRAKFLTVDRASIWAFIL